LEFFQSIASTGTDNKLAETREKHTGKALPPKSHIIVVKNTHTQNKSYSETYDKTQER